MMVYLIIGGIALLTFLGSVTGAYFSGRSAGKEAVQAQWDADKAARVQRTTEIVLQQTGIRDKLEADLRKAQDATITRTVVLREKVPAALGATGTAPLPSAAVELFNNAVRGSEAPSGPATRAAEGPAATVADLAETCVENVGRHQACITQVKGWQRWWNEVKQTYKEGE